MIVLLSDKDQLEDYLILTLNKAMKKPPPINENELAAVAKRRYAQHTRDGFAFKINFIMSNHCHLIKTVNNEEFFLITLVPYSLCKHKIKVPMTKKQHG